MSTLEEAVRHQIGEEGPQLPSDEYHHRIDDLLEHMSAADLLRYISRAMESAGITFGE